MSTQNLPPSFLIICRFLIDELERGYSNLASDRGGETKYGISKKAYPHLDIARLTYDDALQIYFKDYWCAAHCDQLPVRMAAFVFDGAVQHRRLPNSGFVGATFLQKALGVTPDGVFGPQSLGRAWDYKNNAEVVPLAFALRSLFYNDIVKADSTQAVNHKGWFKRLFVMQQFIGSLVTDPNEVRR